MARQCASVAPIVPIIHEAGGRFTTLNGGPVRAWSTALASNGKLHAAAIGMWDTAGGDAAMQVESIHQRQNS